MSFGYYLALAWLMCTCSEKINCGIIYKSPPETKRKQNNLVFNHIHVLKMPMLSLKDYFIYNQPEDIM